MLNEKQTQRNTTELIDKIFKDPKTKYELSEFDNLGKAVHDIIKIYPKQIESGRETGKTKFFIKSFVPFSSGKEEIQVFAESGKSCPEEIVRQLWVYKLIHTYGYQIDEIELEKSVYFGSAERGGKNNSGDYEYRVDKDGNFMEDDAGQAVIDQDLVNYSLKPHDLADAATLPEANLCVAEAFVRFAQKHDLDFWRAG